MKKSVLLNSNNMFCMIHYKTGSYFAEKDKSRFTDLFQKNTLESHEQIEKDALKIKTAKRFAEILKIEFINIAPQNLTHFSVITTISLGDLELVNQSIIDLKAEIANTSVTLEVYLDLSDEF